MVGKRRPHKTRLPYRKVVGKGEIPSGAEGAELELPQLLEEALVLSSESDNVDTAEINSQPTRDLPLELIDMICGFCPKKFHLLFVNKRWFSMALPHVYAYPNLTPPTFAAFVEVISKYKELGGMVRELDLVKIAQVGRNSMVSRLLRRCSPKIELFRAPQSHFGYSPMISLSSCLRLKFLDLSLVSETLDLPQLFKTIQQFHDLEVLLFPRSSIKCNDDAQICWPPNLRQLGLSGGFPSLFLETTDFPPSLTQLYISNCPYMTTESLNSLLGRIGRQLVYLSLTYPIPNLNQSALDFVFLQCPNLVTLQVSVDYMSNAALDPDSIPEGHSLRNLLIRSSGLMGHSDKIRPSDVLLATESLTSLRRISVSLLLGWNPENSSLLGLADEMTQRGGGVWMK